MFVLDSRGGHNRYRIRTDFFETWSPEMAYILGLLYADGNIGDARESSRTQYFSFSSVDVEILEAVKAVIGSEHNISYRASRNVIFPKNKIYRCSGAYRLRIGSKKMFNDLLKLGLTPRKSLTIKFPKNIPGNYIGHFIRGYFDGDGCVFFQKSKGITKPIIIKKLSIIFTSGSYVFLKGLAKIIKNRLSIDHDKIYNGDRAFQLKYSTGDSIKIFEFMYGGCSKSLYLKRKFDTFKEYFQMTQRKSSLGITQILNDLS